MLLVAFCHQPSLVFFYLTLYISFCFEHLFDTNLFVSLRKCKKLPSIINVNGIYFIFHLASWEAFSNVNMDHCVCVCVCEICIYIYILNAIYISWMLFVFLGAELEESYGPGWISTWEGDVGTIWFSISFFPLVLLLKEVVAATLHYSNSIFSLH